MIIPNNFKIIYFLLSYPFTEKIFSCNNENGFVGSAQWNEGCFYADFFMVSLGLGL